MSNKVNNKINQSQFVAKNNKLKIDIVNYLEFNDFLDTINQDDVFTFSNSNYNGFSTSSITAGTVSYTSKPLVMYCKSLFRDNIVKDFSGRIYSDNDYPFFGFTLNSNIVSDQVWNFNQSDGRIIMALYDSGLVPFTVVFQRHTMDKPDWIMTDEVEFYKGYIKEDAALVTIYGYLFRRSATFFAIPILSSEISLFNASIKTSVTPTWPTYFYKIGARPILPTGVYSFDNVSEKIKIVGSIMCPSMEYNYTNNTTMDYENVNIFTGLHDISRITDSDVKSVFISHIILYNSKNVPMMCLYSTKPFEKNVTLGYNFQFEHDIFGS